MTANRISTQEYAVIGLGRFGVSLAKKLEDLGNTVLGIDRKMKVVQSIADELTQTVCLEATDEKALNEVDIASFSTVVVSIGENLESSILVTSALKNLGVRYVVCRAATFQHGDILLRVGADQIVYPYQDSGERLAEILSAPRILERLELGPDHSVAEVVVPDSMIGLSISKCNLDREHHLVLLLIKRNEDLIVFPDLDMVLERDDALIVVGENRRIIELGAVA
jgi:trk system potassium uptake protein TrkA